MLVKYKEYLISYSLICKPRDITIKKADETGRVLIGSETPERWIKFSEAQRQNHNLLYEDWVKQWKN